MCLCVCVCLCLCLWVCVVWVWMWVDVGLQSLAQEIWLFFLSGKTPGRVATSVLINLCGEQL